MAGLLATAMPSSKSLEGSVERLANNYPIEPDWYAFNIIISVWGLREGIPCPDNPEIFDLCPSRVIILSA